MTTRVNLSSNIAHAEQYAVGIERTDLVQQALLGTLEEFLNAAIRDVISRWALPSAAEWNEQRCSSCFTLKRFGSRANGASIASSDADLVAEMWPSSCSEKKSALVSLFLELMFQQLQADNRCTNLENVIDYKKTVSFQFLGVLQWAHFYDKYNSEGG